ncbi:hypothetical protein BV22DRAFT_935619 [Leucogyrophana mollusca]|uniref:Uncharacterized protein n=1 Tax=Leucogyrophana mollusca TaxID=85980 RepID=A0ACB8AVA7_9AGAM|nr:hypothetical protein BV22DRAFT_935619 [Leucogyrophana mollusca]
MAGVTAKLATSDSDLKVVDLTRTRLPDELRSSVIDTIDQSKSSGFCRIQTLTTVKELRGENSNAGQPLDSRPRVSSPAPSHRMITSNLQLSIPNHLCSTSRITRSPDSGFHSTCRWAVCFPLEQRRCQATCPPF